MSPAGANMWMRLPPAGTSIPKATSSMTLANPLPAVWDRWISEDDPSSYFGISARFFYHKLIRHRSEMRSRENANRLNYTTLSTLMNSRRHYWPCCWLLARCSTVFSSGKNFSRPICHPSHSERHPHHPNNVRPCGVRDDDDVMRAAATTAAHRMCECRNSIDTN